MSTATGIRTLLETTRAGAAPQPGAGTPVPAPAPSPGRTAPSAVPAPAGAGALRPRAVPAPRRGPVPAGSRPARPANRTDGRAPLGRRLPAVAAPLRMAVATGGPRALAAAELPSVVVRRRRAAAALVVAVLGLLLLALLLAAASGLGAAAAPSPVAPASSASSVTVVRAGESLTDVARRSAPAADVESTVARIRALNTLDGSAVRAGRPLVVPAG